MPLRLKLIIFQYTLILKKNDPFITLLYLHRFFYCCFVPQNLDFDYRSYLLVDMNIIVFIING